MSQYNKISPKFKPSVSRISSWNYDKVKKLFCNWYLPILKSFQSPTNISLKVSSTCSAALHFPWWPLLWWFQYRELVKYNICCLILLHLSWEWLGSQSLLIALLQFALSYYPINGYVISYLWFASYNLGDIGNEGHHLLGGRKEDTKHVFICPVMPNFAKISTHSEFFSLGVPTYLSMLSSHHNPLTGL